MASSITQQTPILSIDGGKLLLRIDLDTLGALAGIAVIIAIEVLAIAIAQPGYDAINQLSYVT